MSDYIMDLIIGFARLVARAPEEGSVVPARITTSRSCAGPRAPCDSGTLSPAQAVQGSDGLP